MGREFCDILKMAKILSKIRKTAVTGLAGLIGFLPIGCAENQKPDIYVQSTIATNYVFGSGHIIGRKDPKKHGGVNQNLVSLSKGNLSGFIWSSYDFQDKELHEIDVGVDYAISINDKLSLTAGYWRWNYPSELLGEHGDNVLNAGASYKGKIDFDARIIHLIAHDNVEDGDFFSGKISKTFPVYKKKNLKVSITPDISIGYSDNFYGVHGLTTITPGASLNFQKGKFDFSLFVNVQDGKSGAEDLTYGGVRFGWAF